MSEASTQGRGEQLDNQSMLSASVQGVSTTIQAQNRSSSNAERTNGRGSERQRVQRSSSVTSDDSHSSAQRVIRTGGRTEAVATGSHVASIASLGSGVSGERRPGRHRRQVIRLPDQPSAQVRQVRRRLPTPEPDTIERVYIQRTPGEVVEEITEIPTTPPPRIQERTVVEPAGPPQVIKRVIRVPPRGGNYGAYQQTGAQIQTTAATGTAATTSFGSIQQAATSFQQDATSSSYQTFAGTPATTTISGNFTSGFNTFDQNYGSNASAFSTVQQGYSFPQGAANFSSQQVSPPVGCHPAFCFYV